MKIDESPTCLAVALKMNRDHKRESPDLRHEKVKKNDKLELPEIEEKDSPEP